MPNFPVGERPGQISQTGTQEALIRNTGTSSVFLDKQSSVNPLAYGLELQPLDSVNWPTGDDLWAVTAAGTTSSLSVLYGASGVSLGAVSAVVTGDVTATITGPVDANILGTVAVDVQNAVINADVTGNIIVDSGTVNVGGILTPVAIEGGGQVLLNQTATVAAGGVTNINVPVPVNGRTYYAFKVQLQINNAQHATIDRILSYTDSFNNFTTMVRGSLTTLSIGIPYIHEFTVPAQENTLSIQLRNSSGALTTDYTIRVSGVNVGQPTPTTNLGYLLSAAETLQVTPPTVAPTLNIWLPPSFQGYRLLIRSNAGLMRLVGMDLGYVNNAGTINQWLVRAYNIGVNTSGIDPANFDFMGNGATSYIPIAGNGRAPRVSFQPFGTNVNSVWLSLVS